MQIIIGWTKSDMDAGYSSFMHGYRPGAEQHVETIDVEPDREMDPSEVAEAVFVATNSPFVTGFPARIAGGIEAAGYHGEGAHYSLSVGDTVTVGGMMLACAGTGWEIVK